MKTKTNQPRFTGIVPPMITPLAEDLSLDEPALERLVEHVIGGGVHALFALGTTGEAPSLPMGMRIETLRCLRYMVQGRVPVIVNVTSTCLDDSLRLAKTAAHNGCSAVAIAPPYYYPIPQAALREYVRQFIEASPLPTLLYNIPSHTKVAVELDTVRWAMQDDRVIGLKDSSMDMGYFRQVGQILPQRPDWSLLVGSERAMVETMKLGGHGCVGGAGNVWPRLLVDLYEAIGGGDAAAVRKLDAAVQRVAEIFAATELENGAIHALKWAASRLGLCDPRVSPPLLALSPARREAVQRKLEETGLLECALAAQ